MANKQFPSNTRYIKLEVRTDLADILKKIAKHRGDNLQELLETLIEENVDDCELMEIGYEDYLQKG